MKNRKRTFPSLLPSLLTITTLSCLALSGPAPLVPAASAQSNPPRGSYGFLVTSAVAPTSTGGGTAILGVLNLDGSGNAGGTYNLQTGSSGSNPGLNLTGTFTGTYSSNPDETATTKLTFDLGDSFTFATVVTDGGQGLQLVATGCTDSCDLGGTVISGIARAANNGPVKGAYGYLFRNSPIPGESIGICTFDGSGNTTVSLTAVSAPSGPGHDPHNAPVFIGTSTGTYTLNADGSGTLILPGAFGGQSDQKYALVMVDGGSQFLSIQIARSSSGVASGIGRLQ